MAKDEEIKQKDRERQLAKRSVEKSQREKELAREKERIRKSKQRAKTGLGSESGSNEKYLGKVVEKGELDCRVLCLHTLMEMFHQS